MSIDDDNLQNTKRDIDDIVKFFILRETILLQIPLRQLEVARGNLALRHSTSCVSLKFLYIYYSGAIQRRALYCYESE